MTGDGLAFSRGGALGREELLRRIENDPPLISAFSSLEDQLQPNGFDLSVAQVSQLTGPGAIGNLVDRIRYGYVIDFIDFYVTRGANEHHWPTFNVADVWICVGVGLMAIDMLTGSHRSPLSERESPAAPSARSDATSPPEAAPAAGLPEPPG